MNSNSLPIALMQSLAASVPSLKWGPEDDYNAMFGRALTYLVVFSTLGMVVSLSSAIASLIFGKRIHSFHVLFVLAVMAYVFLASLELWRPPFESSGHSA